MTDEKSSITPLAWFGIGAIFVAFIYSIVALFDTSAEDLSQANAIYQQGETAATVGERKAAFNQALSLYLKLEERYRPTFGNGKLYYNIGNAYYQLGEYPLAIWSYSQAKLLMPRNENVEHNLKQALKQAGFADSPKATLKEKVLVYFSLPERLQMILVLLTLSFILVSLSIWLNLPWLKKLVAPLAVLLVLLLASVFYTQFIDPSEGVILKGASLHRDAGTHYAKVTEDPLKPGLKVEVLTITHGGRWIKIITPEGSVGFVHYENVKLL